eukprot:scaffold14067_cov15-Tisochrysis_lutea.AAC.1
MAYRPAEQFMLWLEDPSWTHKLCGTKELLLQICLTFLYALLANNLTKRLLHSSASTHAKSNFFTNTSL